MKWAIDKRLYPALTSFSLSAHVFPWIVGDSHQFRKMITVKRLMVFYMLLSAKYFSKENSQVVASKERWQTCFLKPSKSMIFPSLQSRAFKSIKQLCRQMSLWVSQCGFYASYVYIYMFLIQGRLEMDDF